ncbi:MAG: tripartite tricarboxylate transporter substrate binding protein [Betaproteobacteria bacterium]|nr:tripartite tricarboxylate transporter substrate binding protein [Betaproteobacteria bacterium]MBI2960434.1 tripartite tricarboxylate transporter substrate binding protein [Betaproteobacteria bacterium]
MWARIVAVLFALAAGIAQAQQYPAKPVRIVVPFPPGGPTDIAARFVANHFTKAFGHAATVENISGAGGIVGSDRVAKSPPDGYTVLMGSSNAFSVAHLLYPNIPFDALKDFAPISIVIRTPNYLVVNPKVPANTVQELIAYARKNPGKLNYSSAGAGTSTHMNMELFKNMTGVFILHIPYKGSAPSVASVVAGETQMAMETGPALIPHVKAGRLKMLAATTIARTRALPQVPTVAESGLKGFDAYTWFGMVAPAGVSREIVQKLHAETVKALAVPDVRQKLENLGAEVIASTPEEFTALQKSEIAKWAKLVKEAGIKAE